MNPVRDCSLMYPIRSRTRTAFATSNGMYYTYVIQSKKSKQLYTGSTDDLRKRLNQHNEGKSIWTKSRGSWDLIYYEACLNEEDARSREKYLKTGMGKCYLKNRLRRFLSLTG